jgi:hypothetical protein
LFHGQLILGELANGDRRAINGHRGNHGVHPRAVGEARIHHGVVLVNPSAQGSHNALNDAHDMVIVPKHHIGLAQLSFALHPNLPGAVDHDFTDLGIVQQRLDGAVTQDLVAHLAVKPTLGFLAQGNFHLRQGLGKQPGKSLFLLPRGQARVFQQPIEILGQPGF